MRNIINISLPPRMAREVEREVVKGRYASTSEFFRRLIRDWLEERLARDVRESEREFRAGKGQRLRSLKDLW